MRKINPNTEEIAVCIVPTCSRDFIKRRLGRNKHHFRIDVRPAHCKTCSRNCSRLWISGSSDRQRIRRKNETKT